jgi:hypothetical protein
MLFAQDVARMGVTSGTTGLSVGLHDLQKRKLGIFWPTVGTRYAHSMHRGLPARGQYLTIEQKKESQ